MTSIRSFAMRVILIAGLVGCILGNVPNVQAATPIRIYRTASALSWGGWYSVSGQTETQIGAASFRGRMFITHRGQDRRMYIASSDDGLNFSGWQAAPGTTDQPVAMATFVGRLWQVHRGDDLGMYLRWSVDGNNWSGWENLGGQTQFTVSLAEFKNNLYITHRGEDGKIYYKTLSVDGVWSGWQGVPGGITDLPVSLAVNAGKLYLAQTGQDGQIYFNLTNNGGSWSGWQSFIPAQTNLPVTLGGGNGRLYLTHIGQNKKIYTTFSTDGAAWNPWTEEGGETDYPITLVNWRGIQYQIHVGRDSRIYLRARGGGFLFFQPNDFQRLYRDYEYSSTVNYAGSLVITGNSNADNRIRNIAESRGYQRRREAVGTLLLGLEGETLQPEAAYAFLQMKNSARNGGISMALASGYRAPNFQRSLFMNEFQSVSLRQIGRMYNNSEVANGSADGAINQVLNFIAPPGYSRHHTGFTVDLIDPSARVSFTQFDRTPAYAWLSGNNFYNAKRFGFIPSYPAGGTNMGPLPESWELVWVGTDAVTL
jgi:D-alanyl-D-alanine carboxypeptidase